MAVKVITRKNDEPQKESRIVTLKPVPQISAPQQTTENIIIRIIKVMLMDVRLLLDKQYRNEYNDYASFCDLARGKR